MANALGIDLGNVYRTVEAVKASRATRGAAERTAQNALAARGAAATLAANPSDPAALAGLVALDPQMAQDVLKAYEAADTNQRAQLDRQNEVLGQAAAAVLQSSDPAAAYAQMRSQLPPEAQAGMPAEYNENWVTLQLSRATEVDKLYATITDQATAATNRTNALADDERDQQQAIELEGVRHNNQLARDVAQSELTIQEQEAKAVAEGAAAGIDNADASLIYRQSVGLMGGTFDQAGNLQSLDPALAAKVQEITARASRIYREMPPGQRDHAEAVKQAAQALGIQFPSPGSAPAGGNALAPAQQQYGQGDDPMGLLN